MWVGHQTEELNIMLDGEEIKQIQGAIVVASFAEVIIGLIGGMGFLLRYIGPLTIAPTISLVGLPLAPIAALFCAKHWWIAVMTIALVVIFSQYLRGTGLPCMSYSSEKGFRMKTYRVFHLYAVVLAIAIAWGVCALLTVYDVLPADPAAWGHLARTDVNMDRLTKASWFRFPYPFQWGLPTVSVAAVCGMLAAVFAAMIEVIGSFYAAAKMAEMPPPPVHAINRGILAQGVGCVLAGLWGTGTGTAIYTENIAIIGITNVASRRVFESTGVLMIIFGTVGKISGFFATIPDPVIGGVFMVMFGMITAVGILNLQMVDLRIPRNLFIAGFSLFLGLSVPGWVAQNRTAINTGVQTLDDVLLVFCSTGMLVGGVTAFFLDNTIPGTEEERGLKLWRENLQQSTNVNQSEASSYDLPFGMAVIRKSRWGHCLPVSPTFSIGQSDTADQPDGQTQNHNMTPIPEEGGIDNVTFNDFNSVDTQM
ncbi:Solute carrier family 23 member 2 [Lamellibrachia satsuma]|nr:Solute carrier family 23 member 2 [Lamellibrachia satsuma]